MITLNTVSKRYRKNILFKKVSFSINKCGIYSFVGENGCGKTTLLNIICKFIKPSKGKVDNKIKNITYVSQNVNLIDHLTVKDHFEMFNVNTNVLKRCRLIKKLNSYPKELSKGQKQRIACLLAVHSSSSILVADEPTSHLDKKNILFIIKEIIKISKKKIVLLVSHDHEIIEKYSDEIYKIEDKELKVIRKTKNDRNKIEKTKLKINFKNYIKNSLKFYKKINFLTFFIFFIIFLLLIFSINFNFNVNRLLEVNINNSLDYNKFYLKECNENNLNKITVKKCRNLSEEKLEILKNSEHKIGYNYDLLMNSLYETNNFNVINKNDYSLKDGEYPSIYNEVITGSKYKIGDRITLKASKVISDYKTDIYVNTLELKVVGIVENTISLNKNNYYLDYTLLETYLKKETLINNDISLYDYFTNSELNDYKYVIYFNKTNIQLLNDNDIDYLSSSYDYYSSIKTIKDKINECLIYLNILIIVFGFYFLKKLIKKKILIKSNEILFLKSMGVKENKIIKILNKENKYMINLSFFIGLIFSSTIIYLLFNTLKISYICFFSLIISFYISRFVIKTIIRKRERI